MTFGIQFLTARLCAELQQSYFYTYTFRYEPINVGEKKKGFLWLRSKFCAPVVPCFLHLQNLRTKISSFFKFLFESQSALKHDYLARFPVTSSLALTL